MNLPLFAKEADYSASPNVPAAESHTLGLQLRFHPNRIVCSHCQSRCDATKLHCGPVCNIGPSQIVRRFATDPRIKVALLSVTAAGTGLDFSAASHVVFAELPHEV